MKKLLILMFALLLGMNSAYAGSCSCRENCSYRVQKRMLHNHKMIKNKVINAQVKGKMLAIQELAKSDYCNNPETKQKIRCYQKQIEDLTNQKIFLRKEYRESLRKLKASR